ncbi:hypothetical protein QVD17_05560 [Tagetes erecta]|uniref:Uncharacterized protein n=1 Tax=Tagetes erecta TaxID=13708 RepID=A0AAD8P5L6_TARER|nr:hypothetical protein QVD17_05560 [Tagetes erecta]
MDSLPTLSVLEESRVSPPPDTIECNLDFKDLTGNHSRKCDKFYHLIPLLGRTAKVGDSIKIPVFSVQVTLFPNSGISIGMTNHHILGDANTYFLFWKAWSLIAQSGSDESFLATGTLPVYDRLTRMDPPIPAAYFGNCLVPCMSLARTGILKEKEGYLTAAKMMGENLHRMLSNKDGVLKYLGPVENWFPKVCLKKITSVTGTLKVRYYDLDFGFGKPKKHETVSMDYIESISISACRESNEDLEIGVCLSATEMDVFVSNFNSGLESYISV